MYKITIEKLLELLKQAHSQGTELCNCEFDINDEKDSVATEEVAGLMEIIQDWIDK